MEIQERAVYTTADAAKILKLSPITVERKIRRGEIPAAKIGRKYRLLGRDILSLFGWVGGLENIFTVRFNRLWEEARKAAEKTGFSAKDIPRLIEEVRREQKANV